MQASIWGQFTFGSFSFRCDSQPEQTSYSWNAAFWPLVTKSSLHTAADSGRKAKTKKVSFQLSVLDILNLDVLQKCLGFSSIWYQITIFDYGLHYEAHQVVQWVNIYLIRSCNTHTCCACKILMQLISSDNQNDHNYQLIYVCDWRFDYTQCVQLWICRYTLSTHCHCTHNQITLGCIIAMALVTSHPS